MSDVPKTVEETPAPAAEPTPVFEATEAAKASETTAESEPSGTVKPSQAEATIVGGEATPILAKEEPVTSDKSSTAIEASPATEGVLGYKTPGFIPKFRFHEHYFWFEDAPATSESLTAYVRSKDLKTAHPNAAWAQETGKGLFFYAKRVEDKSSPAGIINLSDATSVTAEGTDEFFFKAHGQKHTFQAKSTAERSSWVVALEKKIQEAKAMKDEIHGSEGYNKHMESFTKAPALAAATAATTSTSREPKKSLDAAHVTNSINKNVTSVDGTNEEKTEKDTSKSRSQSRKRGSIFGALLGKKEEKDEQKELKKEEKAEEKAEKQAEKEVAKEHKAEGKEVKKEEKAEEKAEEKTEKKELKEEKAEEKAEKKAEKEEVKEEKKVESEQKKEEAKATHEPSTAAEAGVAAAGAAVPAAAVVAEERKQEKPEAGTNTLAAEKKSKRGSIFGSLFSKKDATSPTTEKAEKDAAPLVPTKDGETLPVSETAPKIEEPIANKPIDTAAVTAPIDTVQTPAAVEETPTETPKETTAAETATTPTKEKKGGLIGFIKKEAAKLEGKKEIKKEETAEKREDKAAENINKDPVATAATTEAPVTTEETAAPTTEEARPTDKRRSSLFGNLSGTVKKITQSSDSTDAEATEGAPKREKSPLPQRIGSIFRRPSRGVKSEEPKQTTAAATEPMPATETTPAPISKETAMTNGVSSSETPGSAIVGDVHDNMHSTIHDAVTSTPEVKATA